MLDFARRTSNFARIALVILYFKSLWSNDSLVGNLNDHFIDTVPTIVSLNNATIVDDVHPTITKCDEATKNPQGDMEQFGSHETPTQTSPAPSPTRTCMALGRNGTTWNVAAFPHLIIVGAAKAGTTALGRFLGLVPNFQRTIQEEPHFWDGFVHGKAPRQWSSHVQRCQLLQQYHSYWPSNQIGPESITFEKTPSLLAISSKPGMIRALLDPHLPKILIVLRNPVDRFYSNYKMNLQRNRGMVSKSIAVNVKWEVAKLQNLSIIDVPVLSNRTQSWNPCDFVTQPSTHRDFDWRWSMVARGFYAPQIERYMQYFPLGTSLKVIQYENFTRNKVETLNEILEWMGVPPHFNWTEQELQQHYGPAQKATSKDHPMPTKIKKYLEHLYQPFNERLAALLGEQWRGVWDSDHP